MKIIILLFFKNTLLSANVPRSRIFDKWMEKNSVKLTDFENKTIENEIEPLDNNTKSKILDFINQICDL